MRQRSQEFVFDAIGNFSVGSCFMLSGQKLFAFFLSAFTSSDIAQDHRVKLLTLHFNLRNRSFNRKFLAVRTNSGKRSERTHRPLGHARLAKRANVFTVYGAQTLRNKAIDRLPSGVGSRTTEHCFGGGIEYCDPLILIDSDD